MHQPALVVANWKMALNHGDAIALAKTLARDLKPRGVQVVICPSFPALAGVAGALAGSLMALGAQDVFWETRGPYTGEVSIEDLRWLGCRYVIVGHSERRHHLAENEAMIHRKVLTVIGHGLSPILCVGETSSQRRQRIHHHVVGQQVQSALKNLPPPRHGQTLVVAYEPVWAISPGGPAEPADAQAMASVIHQALVDLFGERIVDAVTRIIYGGSVGAANVSAFVDRELISGVLVGAGSLKSSTLIPIINQLS